MATAMEWNAEKQLTVIPTLLRGKLIDYYVELNDATKADLKFLFLRAALQERAGKKDDPLVASKHLIREGRLWMRELLIMHMP